MSELGCNFQIPASDTIGGVVETRTLLQNVTDGRWKEGRKYVWIVDKGKTICPSPLCGGGHKNILAKKVL